MKKIILGLSAIVLIVSAVLIGCKKGEDVKNLPLSSNTPKSRSINVEAQCQNVGLFHNQGLEYVFNQLQDIKKNGPLVPFSTEMQFASQCTYQFYLTKGYTGDNLTIENYVNKCIIPGIPNATAPSGYLLNATLISFSSELRQIIDEYYGSNEFDNMIVNLKNTFKGLSSDYNYQVGVISACNVTIASHAYWNANFDKWDNLVNDIAITDLEIGKPNKKDVLYADAIGALTGGVRGGYTGSVVGPGGILAGAVLGAATGAIAGSAGEYFHSWVKSWF